MANNPFSAYKKFNLGKIGKFFRRFSRSKFVHRALIALGSTVIFAAILFTAFNLIYNQRILPHTNIGQTSFGGLRREEALGVLSGLENRSENGRLNFSWNGKDYVLTKTDLEVDWQSRDQETLDRLFAVGRSGSITQILKEQTRAVFGANQVFAAFSYSGENLADFLKTIAADIDKPEKDASIVIKDNKPEIIPEEIGQKFPLDDNQRIALETIGSFNFSGQTLFTVVKVNPKVTTLGAQAALAQTELLLSRHLILKAGDKTFQIYPKDVADLIGFVTIFGNKGVLGEESEQKNNANNAQDVLVSYILSPELSSDKVGAFVDKIAAEVDQEAKDAKFEVSGGRVQAFQVAQTGYALDKEKAISLIIEALKNGNPSVELPVKVTEPAITETSSQGIKELIGEGRTSWRGSPPNRIHNLTLGANNISGTIVMPGQEFSTLKAIGHVGPQTGFLQELVIKNSTRVEPEYGGGLCQVSTTLFRAVIYSGLKVTARTPHSFRVSYYEPPVGMDATVYDPAPDFKFVNDMKTPILIWAIAGNNSLVFQIYGTKDGRQVNISNPVTYDYVPAGAPIYTESATMATGAIRQVERATSGCSASFNYRVTATDGTVLENQTFVSKYVPIPNSYLYGPGTTGIPGQEASPSAPTPTPSPTPFKKPGMK